MNFIMSPDRMEMLLNNDREWRTHILTKLDRLEKGQIEQGLFINTLKVKIGFIAVFFGFVGSISYTLITSIIKGS